MNEYTSIYLRDIYECERKALAKAACNAGEAEDKMLFMRGIINMVSEIEGKLLDDEAEKEATKNDT